MASAKPEPGASVRPEPGDVSVKPEPADNMALDAPPAPAKPGAEDQEKTGLPHLQRMVSERSTEPERLEDAVAAGMRFLQDLKEPLEGCAQLSTTQAPRWLKSINDLEALAKPSRTIVGVVGNTGAGKSSVISAVLDEER
jgi:hypothetical protein